MNLRKLFFSPAGKFLIALIGLGIYFLVFIYPINSLFSKMHIPVLDNLFSAPFTWIDFVFICLFLLPFLGRLYYQFTRTPFSRHLMAIAMTWSGFAFFLFFPTLTLDFAQFVFEFTPSSLAQITSTLFIIACVLAVFGIFNANRLVVNEVTISHKKIKEQSTAIQLSDVHIGSRSSWFINKLVKRVNELNANKVFITGDLVDLSCVKEKDLAILKNIKAPVYFVTGNHDRYVNLEKLLPILHKQDFTILRNERLSLPDFDLIGIDDAENPKQVEMKIQDIPVDKNRFNILLYHRPQGFEVAVEKGVDLMLSGHTHNGQIVPFNFMVKRIFNDIKGTIHRHGSTLHVSTGTSTWGPIMRIGSNNEITFFHFKPE